MMKTFLKIKKIPFLVLVVLGLISINRVWADETKTAEIKLSFHAQDSLKTCHALVMSEGKPLANVAVKSNLATFKPQYTIYHNLYGMPEDLIYDPEKMSAILSDLNIK